MSYKTKIYTNHFKKHQQQVSVAIERAKQVTMSELNAIIGVRFKF